MSVNTEKSPKTWGSRLSFLQTKRAIAALSLLVTVAVILIALGATHTIGGSSSSGSKQADSNSTSNSSGTASSQGASQLGATSSATTLPAQASPTQLSSPQPSLTQTSRVSAATATPSATSTSAYAGSLADGTPLRVMCLGASIVKGETSNGTIGFRKVLRDDLVGFGVAVNMVGSVRLGDMIDNDVEAYGGNRITQIHDHAKNIVPETLPNVFVINVGTNNILQNLDVDKAGEQMTDFINYLLETSPRSFVVLSTLLTNTAYNDTLEPDVLDINAQYRALMPTFEKEGKAVVLAELHPSEGGDVNVIPQVADIGPDGSHPLASGYEKMGHIFAQAVKAADAQGLVRIATDNGIPADGEAERTGTSSKKLRQRH